MTIQNYSRAEVAEPSGDVTFGLLLDAIMARIFALGPIPAVGEDPTYYFRAVEVWLGVDNTRAISAPGVYVRTRLDGTDDIGVSNLGLERDYEFDVAVVVREADAVRAAKRALFYRKAILDAFPTEWRAQSVSTHMQTLVRMQDQIPAPEAMADNLIFPTGFVLVCRVQESQ